MLPLWFVHTIEETENPSVMVGGGGCGLIVFCSWMIPSLLGTISLYQQVIRGRVPAMWQWGN